MKQAASFLADLYNIEFKNDLAPPAASLDGVLHFLDTYSWLASVVANPELYGLTNVTTPCYPGSYTGGVPPEVCQNPDSYLFLDNQHPTAAVHELLAEQAWAFVPSPRPGVGLLSLGLRAFLGLKRKGARR